MYKLSLIGASGRLLGWINCFLTGRVLCVRVGNHLSEFRAVKTGVPQGAVLSPLLFNIMLYDFPSPTAMTKRLLFADDITVYAKVKVPAQAEPILQPYLEKIGLWGRKWKFRFSGEKSAAMVFTRAYKPGDDPLFFICGERIRTVPHFKLLGVTFDCKLHWHKHIDDVVSSCSRLKNLFSIIAKTRYGPPVKTLVLLYKSLVQSKIDYGIIAYGAASKSRIERVNVAARAILRLILGARASTPIEILYAELGVTPVQQRRSWLTTNYLIKLSHNPNNSTYASISKMFHNPRDWPVFSTPCVAPDLKTLQRLSFKLFKGDPEYTRQVTARPPSEPPLCDTLWFPFPKKQAISNKSLVLQHFQSLINSLPTSTILAYTDGSLREGKTACAVYIPELNISQSWLLKSKSSDFSAELIGISQALKIVYEVETSPEELFLFSDSKAAIQAITSPLPPSNNSIPTIHNLLRCLKSVGTKVTLIWIPSHTGIPGNETADRLASEECSSPSRNRIRNALSAAEQLFIFRESWTEDWLHRLKSCQKPTVQLTTQVRRIDWLFSPNRQVTVCLHRLRSGHNYLNAFAHRINKDADPSCRRGCEAIENGKHVLLDCTALQENRRKIVTFFSSSKLILDANSLLGLNPDIPKSVQFKIRNLLSQYLVKTGLIHTI